MRRLICLLLGHDDTYERVILEYAGKLLPRRWIPRGSVKLPCAMLRCRRCGRRILGLPMYGGHHVWVKVASRG
jgi:hypothetical protein